MKIEHWRSQRHYPQEQLNYGNLLGACKGGEGLPFDSQHCDTRKGEQDLRWNPANPAHRIEARIWYEPDGTIRSHDATFDKQLATVLNLNLPVLKNGRRGVLDVVLKWWEREKRVRHGKVPRARLEQERHRQIDETGDLKPFCQIAVWWIDQRLARMSA